jgi:hypothetical protein
MHCNFCSTGESATLPPCAQMRFAYASKLSQESPAKCKRKIACARQCTADMPAAKSAVIQVIFSSDWPLEPHNPVSAQTASSAYAIHAGSVSNEICQDFSIPFCLSHELVDGFAAALRMRILAFICSRTSNSGRSKQFHIGFRLRTLKFAICQLGDREHSDERHHDKASHARFEHPSQIR